MNHEERDELSQIVPSILDEAARELRTWLHDRVFYDLYAPELRKRIEVLVAELDQLRCELDAAPVPINPKHKLGV